MRPYVRVYQSPLGWVLEVNDATDQVVMRERPLRKPTMDDKRRALNRYLFKNEENES